jgi:hypothetical protein
MVRMDFQIRPCVNRIVIPSEVEESRGSTLRQRHDILFSSRRSARITAHAQQKTRIEMFNPGFSNLTPPMPFRRITRSLSVTGG